MPAGICDEKTRWKEKIIRAANSEKSRVKRNAYVRTAAMQSTGRLCSCRRTARIELRLRWSQTVRLLMPNLCLRRQSGPRMRSRTLIRSVLPARFSRILPARQYITLRMPVHPGADSLKARGPRKNRCVARARCMPRLHPRMQHHTMRGTDSQQRPSIRLDLCTLRTLLCFETQTWRS